MPHYEFDSGSSKVMSTRHHRGLSSGSGYKLYPTSSINTNDDSLSFTYSASSSQADNWSEGSVTDFPDDLIDFDMNPSFHSMQQNRQRNDGRLIYDYRVKQSASIQSSKSTSRHQQASQNASQNESSRTPKNATKRIGSPVSTITTDCNPPTPPPRHSSQKSVKDDAEVWYQSWWMCSFTDSLNLNI